MEKVKGSEYFLNALYIYSTSQKFGHAYMTHYKRMLFNRLLPAPARPASITTLDGSDLEYVDNYKYLGDWLDCKLSFQTHIKHLQSKIKSRIGFLFRNKSSFTHAAKHTLVKLTILPILDFGNVIYKIPSNTLHSITVPSV